MMKFDIFEYSSCGGREYNEDCICHIEKNSSGLFVVADGLGGHLYGELASKCVCDTLSNNWELECQDRKKWLDETIQKANKAILDIQKEKATVLKSTVAALTIDNDKAYWANVGDSRLYYIHGSEIYGRTEDHSVAYKKYKAGEISRDEIGQDEDQSRLLRSLGSEERFEAQIYESDILLDQGDAFLLCSDGVWEYLRDEEIVIDYCKAENSKEWAELLLVRLMDRIDGNNDNLSLICLMI